jgi:hypothetical protein
MSRKVLVPRKRVQHSHCALRKLTDQVNSFLWGIAFVLLERSRTAKVKIKGGNYCNQKHEVLLRDMLVDSVSMRL